jgi:hypothetical protein
MKLFATLATAFAIVASSTAFANEALTKAIDAAFEGKETKFVKVDGHEFHIKPITVVKDGKNIGATGRISHHLSARPDDQINYKIVIKDGKEATATTDIDRGGLGRLVGVPGKLADKGGKLVDGSWESACAQIINTISLKLELK